MTEVGDVVIARLVASYLGQPIVNTFSFVAKAAYTTFAEAAADLYTSIDTALGVVSGDTGLWAAQQSSSYGMSSVDVVDIVPGTAAMVSFTATAFGAIATDGMPPNDCLAITWRTGVKGAGGRGRTYLTAQVEANQAEGAWSDDAQAAATDIAAAMVGTFGGEGSSAWTLVVLHRIAAGVPLVPPQTNVVTSYSTHPEVRSLGRRAMGRKIRRRVTL